KTGQVLALLLDNGYLTDVRTAAAGAVAARHLAPSTVETAGVIGTGVQARLQLKAAHLVRPFEQALVWGRDHDKARACAVDLSAELGIEVRAERDPARLVAQSQLVVTTTPAEHPVLKAEWLHPGLHITAMGSDQAGKNEIEPEALVSAGLYVADRVSQCEKLGELRSALAAGLWKRGTPPEHGEIVSGIKMGRASEAEITICDLTGTGAQDTAIATFALARARAAGAGSVISTRTLLRKHMLKLDDRDLKMLAILREEGRISKAELAKRVNLSAAPCWERLKRLEQAGIITGYRAEVALKKIASHVTVLMAAELAQHRAEDFQTFERAVARHDEIVACWAVGGGFDYILQIVTRDID